MATVTYEAGAAPDIGDVDFLGEQWALASRARAYLVLAMKRAVPSRPGTSTSRLTIGPDPGAFAATGMKWGMRRYNLGDVSDGL